MKSSLRYVKNMCEKYIMILSPLYERASDNCFVALFFKIFMKAWTSSRQQADGVQCDLFLFFHTNLHPRMKSSLKVSFLIISIVITFSKPGLHSSVKWDVGFSASLSSLLHTELQTAFCGY